MTTMRRKGIRKQPPRTVQLAPGSTISFDTLRDAKRRTPGLAVGPVLGKKRELLDTESFLPIGCSVPFREGEPIKYFGRLVLRKPTLRQRWVSWVNSLGGKLLRYGR